MKKVSKARPNKKSGKGNTDPTKSISQKSIIQVTDKCSDEVARSLEEKMHSLGSVMAREM